MKANQLVWVLLLLGIAGVKLPAQTLQSLCAFDGSNEGCQAPLTVGPDGNFYGTTRNGGSYGTIFRVTTNGALTTLVSFANTNGAAPCAALTLGNDGNFYGTTEEGGNIDYGYGTIFRVTTNGELISLVCFGNTNGANPVAPLALGNDGNFYGTTYQGGDSGDGTVFRVTTNGVLTTLVSFALTNGYYPFAGLTLGNDGNFYGTTAGSGSSGYLGNVFKVTTNGVLTSLLTFSKTNGSNPESALTLGSDGAFYGTTLHGGITNSTYPNGFGTIFKVTTNGALTTLVSFAYTNGAFPLAALALGNDGNFYGTTAGNQSACIGNVFELTTNGDLISLVTFANTNGASPQAPLTLGSDGNFYGTTFYGGLVPAGPNGWGYGTVFKFYLATQPLPPPSISIQPQPMSVTNGHAASFFVMAYGVPSLAYQWQFNGTNLNGATNPTLTLQNAFPANAGNYTVAVTNVFGSVTSNPALLTVLPLGITAPTMLASCQFQFSFDTATGVNYAVQYSTNFMQWFPFVTLGGIGVPLTLIDPNTSGSPQRFYRIILSPQ
jgi:uncharacterized repeat protein (TIGR03803 family)